MSELNDKKYDLADPEQRTLYWTKTAENVLLGKKIVRVEYMSSKECDEYMWYKRPITFILDNDTVGGDAWTITPTITNYAGTGNDRYTVIVHNFTGIDVKTNGSGPHKLTGHKAKPFEQQAPITVEYNGVTEFTVTDLTVTQDVKIGCEIIHETIGVRKFITFKVLKSS